MLIYNTKIHLYKIIISIYFKNIEKNNYLQNKII